MNIWANTIVHNEDRFLWFVLMSVVDYVDKILVWDTGSDDKTVEVINEVKRIKKDKILFREVGKVDINQFTKMRQLMLEKSQCDWLLILDGDEIWWEKSIQKVVDKIYTNGSKIEGVVVPTVVPVGDILHLQEEKAGKYKLAGRCGHLNLRAINKNIPGLHVDMPYGRESYFDKNNQPIEERKGIVFLDAPYLHTTHLKRSTKKRIFNKFKFELGTKVSDRYKFPEVLYRPYPRNILSPWVSISGFDKLKAQFLTPLRKFKRRLL